MNPNPLKIYRASAGSGKTYNLALKYIEILFEGYGSYRKILAVTFTNKAAGEMKARIIQKLDQLGRGLPEAADYREHLLKTGSVRDDEQLKRQAKKILSAILNDYSAFYVQTIDKFFQWVIRGFTREIGLQNHFNLELNTDNVLNEAVDMLMYEMDENADLKQWLIQYAEEKMIEGRSWNFHNEIFRLGQEVFKESYLSLTDEISNPEDRHLNFVGLRKDLSADIAVVENFLLKKASEADEIIRNNDLEIENFKYGTSGVLNFFVKIKKKDFTRIDPGKRTLAGLTEEGEWYKNDSYKSRIIQARDQGLLKVLVEAVRYWESKRTDYFTSRALRKNLYSFGILNHISEMIRRITNEKNIFLLPDTSVFLNRIIAENEAPFIFEKAGNYFENFMIDEFQDTSRFQWSNFKPLVQNSLSSGNMNLIVGDVKQSIYRWRNSDWKILAGELYQEFPEDRTENLSLDSNYRSRENIIRFNNSVFSRSRSVISGMIENSLSGEDVAGFGEEWLQLTDQIYGQSGQKLPGKDEQAKGYVSLKFFRDMDPTERLEMLGKELPALICELQDRDYKAGDITILVRKGREGSEIANLLLEAGKRVDSRYNFQVVSNDSLYIGNHSANRFLISVLKFINQSGDKLNSSFLKNEYFWYLGSGNDPELPDLHSIFSAATEDLTGFEIDEGFKTFNREISRLKSLPLFELVEELIKIFQLNRERGNLPYIQAFQDTVLEFIRKEAGDISSFLRYWDESGSGTTLQVSESQDAIRIMTIHKAKGLEFKTVIIPYCDWRIGPVVSGSRSPVLWPSGNRTSYPHFSHFPVMYSSILADTHFSLDYYEETFRSYIDNLNLLYVAFTRAEDELYAFSVTGKEDDPVKTVGDLLLEVVKKENLTAMNYPSADLKSFFDPSGMSLEFGTKSHKPEATGKSIQAITTSLTEYPVNMKNESLGLNHKNIYLTDLHEDPSMSTGYGTQMHEIFARIYKISDTGAALRKAWLKGLLSSPEKQELEAEIHKKLDCEPFRKWFSDEYTVRTESDLIGRPGYLLRPDRVMHNDSETIILDYKFGKIKSQSYYRQVVDYAKVIRDFTPGTIRAFLWYYNLDELEEVKV